MLEWYYIVHSCVIYSVKKSNNTPTLYGRQQTPPKSRIEYGRRSNVSVFDNVDIVKQCILIYSL